METIRGRMSFDELQHAGPEHLDSDYVAGYDRKAKVDPGEDLALLRTRGLGPTSTVVDIGAGTGTFALAAAETGLSCRGSGCVAGDAGGYSGEARPVELDQRRGYPCRLPQLRGARKHSRFRIH